jgi:hypothetical protein
VAGEDLTLGVGIHGNAQDYSMALRDAGRLTGNFSRDLTRLKTNLVGVSGVSKGAERAIHGWASEAGKAAKTATLLEREVKDLRTELFRTSQGLSKTGKELHGTARAMRIASTETKAHRLAQTEVALAIAKTIDQLEEQQKSLASSAAAFKLTGEGAEGLRDDLVLLQAATERVTEGMKREAQSALFAAAGLNKKALAARDARQEQLKLGASAAEVTAWLHREAAAALMAADALDEKGDQARQAARSQNQLSASAKLATRELGNEERALRRLAQTAEREEHRRAQHKGLLEEAGHLIVLRALVHPLRSIAIGTIALSIAPLAAALQDAAAGAAILVQSLMPLAGAGGISIVQGIGAIGLAVTTLKLGLAGVGDALTKRGDQFKTAFEKLTLPAKRFVLTLRREFMPAVEQSRLQIQMGLFPGLTAGLRDAASSIDDVQKLLYNTALAIGDIGRRAGGVLGRESTQRDLLTVGEGQIKLINRGGRMAIKVMEGLLHILVAAQPMLDVFSRWALNMGEGFRSWAKEAREDGTLRRFFREALKETRLWFDILGNVGRLLGSVLGAADDQADRFLVSLERVTQRWSDWAESVKGQRSLKSFFDESAVGLKSFGDILRGLLGLVRDLAKVGNAEMPLIAEFLNNSLFPLIKEFATFLTDSMDYIFTLLDGLFEFIKDVFDAFREIQTFLHPFINTLADILRMASDLIEMAPEGTKLLATLTVTAAMLAGWRELKAIVAGIVASGRATAVGGFLLGHGGRGAATTTAGGGRGGGIVVVPGGRGGRGRGPRGVLVPGLNAPISQEDFTRFGSRGELELTPQERAAIRRERRRRRGGRLGLLALLGGAAISGSPGQGFDDKVAGAASSLSLGLLDAPDQDKRRKITVDFLKEVEVLIRRLGAQGKTGEIKQLRESLRDLAGKDLTTADIINFVGWMRKLGSTDEEAKRVADALSQIDKTGHELDAESLKRFSDGVLNLEDGAKDIEAAFERMARGTSGSIRSLRTNLRLNTRLISNNIAKGTEDWKTAMSGNFKAAITNVKRSMREGTISVRDGMREIRRLVKENLRLYNFTESQARAEAEGNRLDSGPQEGTRGPGRSGTNPPGPDTGAARGFVQFGMPGQRGMDSIPFRMGGKNLMVAPGEVGAVFTGRQQSIVNTALRAFGYGGLGDLFRRERQPHFMARGGSVPAGGSDIVALGHWLQSQGYHVSEHPAFGGVDPVHTKGSWHYRAGALDVNADGRPGGEAKWLDRLAAMLRKAGWSFLWRVADHFDHLHVDMGSGGGKIPLGIDPIKRVMLGGKKVGGDWRSIGQGALDLVRVGANAMMSSLSGTETPGNAKGGKGALSRDAVMDLWRGAGGPGGQASYADTIAFRESGRVPTARGGPNTDGSFDHGLWQINDVHSRRFARMWADRYDPAANASMAVGVWRDAGWNAWTTHRQRPNFRGGIIDAFAGAGFVTSADLQDPPQVDPGDFYGDRPGSPTKPKPKAKPKKKKKSPRDDKPPASKNRRSPVKKGKRRTLEHTLGFLAQLQDYRDIAKFLPDNVFKGPLLTTDANDKAIERAQGLISLWEGRHALSEEANIITVNGQEVVNWDGGKDDDGKFYGGINQRVAELMQILGYYQQIKGLLDTNAGIFDQRIKVGGVAKTAWHETLKDALALVRLRKRQRTRVKKAIDSYNQRKGTPRQQIARNNRLIEGYREDLEDAKGLKGPRVDRFRRETQGKIDELQDDNRDLRKGRKTGQLRKFSRQLRTLEYDLKSLTGAKDGGGKEGIVGALRSGRQTWIDLLATDGATLDELRVLGIPNAQLDIDRVLGDIEDFKGATVRPTETAPTQSPNVDALLQALALSTARFDVFRGFAPILGSARILGSYAHGGVIPETGTYLLHKDERVVPDRNGPFSARGDVYQPQAGPTNVTLVLRDRAGELIELVDARIDSKAPVVVKQELGRSARRIASAPGGRSR